MGKYDIDTTTVQISTHAKERLADRGFTLDLLLNTLRHPETVYEAHKAEYKGQWRVNGNGMSIAYDPSKRMVITVFFNGRLDPNWKKGGK